MLGMAPEEVLEKLKTLPGIKETDAVRNGRIYLLYGQAENVFVRPGPRVAEAVKLLSMMLYPELFNAKLPQVIGDDYSKYLRKGAENFAYQG